MGDNGPRSSLGLPPLPNKLEEVLPEDQDAFSDLMKRHALSPEHPPRCLPDAKSPL
jgi:hypothetical protein